MKMEPAYVGVDSGLLIIIDPSYLGAEFCSELLTHRNEDGGFDTKYLTPKSRGPLAVVVTVRNDGIYPVDVTNESVTVIL